MDLSNRSFSLLVGIALVSFTSLVLLISSFSLIVGVPISGYHVALAGVLTGAISWWSAGQYSPARRWHVFLIVMLSFASAFVLLLMVGGLIMDTTWDGQTYQAEGIISLAEGWNPYYQASPDHAVFPTWLAFFSKGPWINAATIYRFTGHIETGKVFNFLLLMASFLFSRNAISTFPKLGKHTILLLSLLLTFNPVTLYQMFSFYVDGQLSSCLVIVVALFILYHSRPDRVLLVTLVLLSIYIINLKLSGAIYLSIMAGGMLVWNWLSGSRESRKMVASLFIVWGIAIGIVGYNPFVSQYLTKFVATGNPFDPITWPQLISIEGNSPVNFVGQDLLWKLVTSLFSESQNGIEATRLKLPFTVYPEELLSFTSADPRVAGFGPLFSGVIVLTIMLVTAVGLRLYRRRAAGVSFCLGLSILLLISTLTNSEGWWARYVPQLWIVPVCIAVESLSAMGNTTIKIIALALVASLTLNIVLVGGVHLGGTVVNQMMYWREVAELQQQTRPIEVNFNGFVMMRFRLGLYEIAFREMDSMDCQQGQRHRYMMRAWDAVICLP